MMKRFLSSVLSFCLFSLLFAENVRIQSPDGNLLVNLSLTNDSSLVYNVSYKGKTILENSPLGMITNVADFSHGLTFVNKEAKKIDKIYRQDRIKQSKIHCRANELTCRYTTSDKQELGVVFHVSNNDVAFKYLLPQTNATACCVIEKELTGFDFPFFTTSFITPQATPMIGWKRTKPSYEEEYTSDEPIGTPSKYGLGYTFPALFHVGENGWALLSETGVCSLYCASHLSEGTKDGLYSIAFPEQAENNGLGSAAPAVSLPGETPWRTITVGDHLKPIVETTIPFDVIDPLYEPSKAYQFGRSTWSWLLWQDESINYQDQKAFIDLSAELGYEFALIDGWWDTKIGYNKIEELVNYAKSRSVDVCLWYNSNGYWNDAPQGPKNCMNTAISREKEMKWMQRIGVKGIKVDFFGGDKQETMKLYEDILTDANRYGLMVIFHGCTLPRGWERMFPNFVGSEAVLASENLIFTQYANDMEAYNACLHPFIRNSVGSMEFGPVLLNKRYNRTNDGGTTRKTTEVFQLATAVLFQNPVQNFGITPNNLTDCPKFVLDFMKHIPTTWDETVFIDGYPGKYCVLARRHGNKWYVVGVNAEKQPITLNVELPMLADQRVLFYSSDKKDRSSVLETKTIKKTGKVTFVIQSNGGVILTSAN